MAPTLSSVYMTLYNLIQTGGWIDILYQSVRSEDALTCWNRAHLPLQIFQTASLLESVHAATGLVRSRVATSLGQSIARLMVTYGFCPFVPESPFLQSLTIAWSIADIIRYLYYVSLEIPSFPGRSALKWLRYNAFLLLYPVGMFSEWALMIGCLRKGSSSLAFKLFCLLFSALTVYGYPTVYLHMLKNRRKQFASRPIVASSSS